MLPLAQELVDNIRAPGKGASMYSSDVVRAYRQLPLHLADCPLIYFSEDGRYFMDASLPFGMKLVVASGKDVTPICATRINNRGSHILNYIDDFLGGRQFQGSGPGTFQPTPSHPPCTWFSGG